jgi:hypothetical protein
MVPLQGVLQEPLMSVIGSYNVNATTKEEPTVMKKQLAIAAALVCGGAYATSYVTGPGFTNLDFSSGTAGWAVYDDYGVSTFTTSAGVGTITKGAGADATGIVYQCVPVPVGTTVRLKAGNWSGNLSAGQNDYYWASVGLYTLNNPDAAPNYAGCVDWTFTNTDSITVPTAPGKCAATEFQAAVDYPGNIELIQNPGNDNGAGNVLTSGGEIVGTSTWVGPKNTWSSEAMLTSANLYVPYDSGVQFDAQRINYSSSALIGPYGYTIVSQGYVVIGFKLGGTENVGSLSVSGLDIAVPEPASLGLLALGAMAFLGRRRK